jgi:hypothetical protein
MKGSFGYSNTGGKDWANVSAYDDKQIEAIKDPEGGAEISLPAAIPSPFARIDLVKTAFANICKTENLRATTKSGDVIASKDDEKLVSDCLDLAEMLFNADNIKDNLRIIEWKKDEEIEKLENGTDAQRRFAKTLKLYLGQDRADYNFDSMDALYLVEYNYKIIGCTSPVTMFFTTANNLEHARLKLTKNYSTFDDEYTPLYERDVDFQKYLYLLFKANPKLSSKMSGISAYLKKNLEILDTENPKLYNELNNLKSEHYVNNFSELDTGTSGQSVNILGVMLRKRKQESIKEDVGNSDFVIDSSKYTGEKPLVLQNSLNKPFRYINDLWVSSNKVPFYDSEANLVKRRLPGIKIQYPYLTVSDFLEPYLIKLVYPLYSDKYFDGNIRYEGGDKLYQNGYLIPIKPYYFDFFGVDDIIKGVHADGKPWFEMVRMAGDAVKVFLRVPVKKEREYITFERIYIPTEDDENRHPRPEANEGIVKEYQFGITIFPFIKIIDPEIVAHYRVQLIDRDVKARDKGKNFDIAFFNNNNVINSIIKRNRSTKDTKGADTIYYVLKDNFEYVSVEKDKAKGLILPKWGVYKSSNKAFHFAVDFGTTNTHIEYRCDSDSEPSPFDTLSDPQIASLFQPDKTSDEMSGTGALQIKQQVIEEFLPFTIGGELSKFPQRTVLIESKTLNKKENGYTLADFNIPFLYEKRELFDKPITNLKWSNIQNGNDKNIERIERFLEKLVMLMRNKALINNADLSLTRMIWFYPTSMASGRIEQLRIIWGSLISKYFNNGNENEDNATFSLPESLAPFYYYKKKNKLSGRLVASIDIGGGTTDLVVFESYQPKLMSSFRFGANTIFGEGFTTEGTAADNPMVVKYKKEYIESFEANLKKDPLATLNSIQKFNQAADINALFFSFESNPDAGPDYSYSNKLSYKDDLKILFLYFYASIIYHTACLMKLNGLPMPKDLSFSGTGAKVLTIISRDFKKIAKLSSLIFEKVYGINTAAIMNIVLESTLSKEVTCKGGLYFLADATSEKYADNESVNNIVKDTNRVLTCLEDRGVKELSLEQLDANAKAGIVEFVKVFNEIFIEINSNYSYKEYFNVSTQSMEVFESEMNEYLMDDLETGFEFFQSLDEPLAKNEKLRESLFFYPVSGLIYRSIKSLMQL